MLLSGLYSLHVCRVLVPTDRTGMKGEHHEAYCLIPRHQPGDRAGAVVHHAYPGRRTLSHRQRTEPGFAADLCRRDGFWWFVHLAGDLQVDGEEIDGRTSDRNAVELERVLAHR